MNKGVLVFIATLFITFLQLNNPLSNGRHILALQQFEAAKKAFNRQDYPAAQQLAQQALKNAPESAAPWLLIGNCYYLQGQDQAALDHYSIALKLDPSIPQYQQLGHGEGRKVGHLPPFIQDLRQKNSTTTKALHLTPGKLFTLRKKIGQMIMVSVPGTRLSGQKKMMLESGWIGGVILFSQNIQSKQQIARYVENLQANAPTPLFVAVDQEGGAVRRFREKQGFQTLPSEAALGKTENPKLAYRFGRLSGQQLRDVGANLNLAPVVDIDYGLVDSIISKYHRSLGNKPEVISSLSQEIVRGMRSKNVIATAKHFPSQSLAAVNPHEGVATSGISLAELERWDFLPYRRLIEKNLLDAVMLSHVVYKNVDPYFPASLSSIMIRNLLRKQLGYQGLVISDDLKMDAIKQRYPLDVSVVQAVNAGVDVLLVTDNYERRVMDSVVNAVVTGKIPMKNIDEAYQRIMATKGKYGILTWKKPITPSRQALKKNSSPSTSLKTNSLQLVQNSMEILKNQAASHP